MKISEADMWTQILSAQAPQHERTLKTKALTSLAMKYSRRYGELLLDEEMTATAIRCCLSPMEVIDGFRANRKQLFSKRHIQPTGLYDAINKLFRLEDIIARVKDGEDPLVLLLSEDT